MKTRTELFGGERRESESNLVGLVGKCRLHWTGLVCRIVGVDVDVLLWGEEAEAEML